MDKKAAMAGIANRQTTLFTSITRACSRGILIRRADVLVEFERNCIESKRKGIRK